MKIFDNFINVLKGYKKKELYTEQLKTNQINPTNDRLLVDNSWLRRKIVRTIVQDSLRNGVSFYGDQKVIDQLITKLSTLKFWSTLERSLIDARTTGGCIVLLGILDGQATDQPVKMTNTTKLTYTTMIPIEDVTIKEYSKNVSSPNYLKPEVYTIGGIDYHYTRCIRLVGDEVVKPEEYSGFGRSILRNIDEVVKTHKLTINGIEDIIIEMTFKIMKIPIFAKLMEGSNDDVTTEGTNKALKERIELLNNSLTTDGMIVIDAEESVEKIVVNASGLEPIIKVVFAEVASAADMPLTKLFGQQLGTLAGAEETTRDWYDTVKSFQTSLNDVLDNVFSLCYNDIEGSIPDDFSWEWNNLKSETINEKLDADTKHVNNVRNLFIDGLIGYEEARDSLNSENKDKRLKIDTTKKPIEA